MAIKFLNTVQVDTDVLYVNTANDRVGIGTTSPSQLLDADGDGLIQGKLTVGNSSYYDEAGVLNVYGSGKNQLTIQTSDNSLDRGVAFRNSGGAHIAYIAATNTISNLADLVFGVSDGTETNVDNVEERMRITSAGNVGIGTTSPDATLEIYNILSTSDGDGSATETLSGQDSILLQAPTGANEETNGSITWRNGDRRRAMITSVSESVDGDFKGISFYTQGTDGPGDIFESMRISHSGNVGIGTTSPLSRLHVAGDTYVTNEFSQGVSNSNKIYNYGSEFRTNGASIQIVFGRDGNAIGSGAIGADATNCFAVWNTDDTLKRMVISQSGNVGIGTTSPSALLHVKAATNVTGTIEVQGGKATVTSAGEINSELNFGSNDASATGGIGGSIKSVTENTNGAYVGMSFYTAKQGRTPVLEEAMRIDEDGNVGIGTTSPSAKLEVNGQTVINSTGLTEGFQWFNDTNEIFSLEDTSGAGELLLLSSNSVKVKLNANGNSYFNGGNVGIGTTNPSEKLEVIGRTKITKSGDALRINSSDANGAYVTWRNNGSNIGYIGSGYHLWSSPNNIATSLGIRAQTRLDLGVQANVHMTILNNGNVGIGTTSPSAKLHVDSSTAFSLTDSSGDTLLLTNDSTVSAIGAIGPSIGFGNMNNNNRTSAIAAVRTGGDHDNMGLAFFTHPSDSGDETIVQKMTIDHDGNVGIGTTSPDTLLQTTNIADGTDYISYKIGNTAVNASNKGGFAIYELGTKKVTLEYYRDGSAITNLSTPYIFTIDTNSQERMRITNAGNVGIGTTNPGYKLDVSGDARFTGDVTVSGGDITLGGTGRIQGIDTVSASTDAANKAYVDNSVAAIITPAAPSTVTSTIVGETIEIAFNQSATSDIDYYQVWSSDDGGDYGIIGQITSDDFSATMTVVDTTFVTSGTMSYRVYAVRQGVYSSAATTSKSYTASALSVTNMTVVNLNTAYYIQYEKPNSRFIDHIEIWMDSQTTQAALNRTNATLVYSGQNHSYMRNVNTSNNFHQFWVEIVTS